MKNMIIRFLGGYTKDDVRELKSVVWESARTNEDIEDFTSWHWRKFGRKF